MKWHELSDRKLVELCLDRNEDAIAELLRRYKRMIGRTAAKTLVAGGLRASIPVLEDLVQDTWARIVAHEMKPLCELQWPHDGALRGLLQVTAATATKDHIRKMRSVKRDIRQEDSLTDVDKFLPERGNAVANFEHKILLDQLTNCLENLIRAETDYIRDLAIFRLFFGYRITARDLARVYQMNIRKVENTVARLARLARSHCLETKQG